MQKEGEAKGRGKVAENHKKWEGKEGERSRPKVKTSYCWQEGKVITVFSNSCSKDTVY